VLELGFAVLYQNRTNRSGIVKGGVIGGKDQKGSWKLDARFNPTRLIAKFRDIASYRDRISLYSMDARKFLTDVVAQTPDQTLIYLDPPYYEKGQSLYENHYKHDDHAALAETLQTLSDRPWVVSYDDVVPIREVYAASPHLHYGIKYTASERYEGKEIMFLGPALNVPDVQDPLNVKLYA